MPSAIVTLFLSAAPSLLLSELTFQANSLLERAAFFQRGKHLPLKLPRRVYCPLHLVMEQQWVDNLWRRRMEGVATWVLKLLLMSSVADSIHYQPVFSGV
ncbi:MAG: hypothetical protein MUO67_14790 [Anaerolineales bacterium]|nr:hypothetical protein [Anaerolineales bacterium]